MLLNTLLNELHYNQSAHYHSNISDFEPEITHLFRAAHHAGVSGIYVFNTSPNISDKAVADRPAVYVAQAQDVKQAQRLHRSLWNLKYAPYLIVLLPDQIRVYTGFNYSWKDAKKGLLDEFPLDDVRLLVAEFSSEAIDTGRIWQNGKYKNLLDQRQRVDRRLLENLRQLGEELKKRGLLPSVAHALIGKYVYFRYLWDRGILTKEWLQEQNISQESVLSRLATVDDLSRLTAALESRFNGKIFPIDFTQQDAPTDLHVQLTASVFMGDEIILSDTEKVVQQLHLDFQAYDFEYIPIEILSAVYEQLIEDSKKKGAIYTPEILADYLLSEINAVKPLTEETKILDPACGSGVFLVLAFRRLIEAELLKEGESKLSAKKLKELLSNLYGVEKELDACYVAEFSLILTFLNYIDPRELQKIKFRFPTLHNKKIFHSDFFDIEGIHYDGKFWQQRLKFDWVIGNPPWLDLQGNAQGEQALAKQWMSDRINKVQRPIGGSRVAEAFSWLATDLLLPEGIVGFLLPATSLFNLESRTYRKHFFAEHRVFRITNFSNLRQVLFPKNEYPAFTIVYRRASDTEDNKPPIIHYAPLVVNQIAGSQGKPWVITINEQEIQTVDSSDAETGETLVWKLALWGTFQDKRAIERIKSLFPSTLETFRIRKKWAFSEGSQLRDKRLSAKDKLRSADELKGKKIFQREAMKKSLFRFSVPLDVLSNISEFHLNAQKRIDEKIFDLFGIPDDIRLLVTDFVQVRLSLDRPSALNSVIREPNERELLDYARELRDELDDFVVDHTHHSITITYSPDLIECIVEVIDSNTSVAINSNSVMPGDLTSSLVLSELSKSLREQISQWIYVQRGLRLFDGPRIHLYKLPRLIDWTRTQAMNDAGDIVEEVIADFPLEWVSEHERKNNTDHSIRIYHVLLDCSPLVQLPSPI